MKVANGLALYQITPRYELFNFNVHILFCWFKKGIQSNPIIVQFLEYFLAHCND